jgi:hypothetical protein
MSEFDDAMVYSMGTRADRAQRRSALLRRSYAYRNMRALESRESLEFDYALPAGPARVQHRARY